jgi:hypothetical protein
MSGAHPIITLPGAIMTTTIAADAADRQDERKRKRGAVIKFSLAGAALLGIAAAATSAAWTDQAWFKIDATSATVDLDASIDGVNWAPADGAGTAVTVTIPASSFGNINQSFNKTLTLHLRNSGSVPLTLTQADANGAGAGLTDLVGGIFAAGDPAVVTVSLDATTLAPNAETLVKVNLTTSPTWPATYQGQTGAITIGFDGQS